MDSFIITGEDIDILVFLTALGSSKKKKSISRRVKRVTAQLDCIHLTRSTNEPQDSEMLAIFKDPEATLTQIAYIGDKFLVKLYGGTIGFDNLEDLTYCIVSTVVAKPIRQLARLPPSKADTVKYHSFRTYL